MVQLSRESQENMPRWRPTGNEHHCVVTNLGISLRFAALWCPFWRCLMMRSKAGFDNFWEFFSGYVVYLYATWYVLFGAGSFRFLYILKIELEAGKTCKNSPWNSSVWTFSCSACDQRSSPSSGLEAVTYVFSEVAPFNVTPYQDWRHCSESRAVGVVSRLSVISYLFPFSGFPYN